MTHQALGLFQLSTTGTRTLRDLHSNTVVHMFTSGW